MNYYQTGKYIVRDSAIEVHLSNVAGENSVIWWRSIYDPSGCEIDSQLLKRTFTTEQQAKQFGRILYQQFQKPAFKELEKSTV